MHMSQEGGKSFRKVTPRGGVLFSSMAPPLGAGFAFALRKEGSRGCTVSNTYLPPPPVRRIRAVGQSCPQGSYGSGAGLRYLWSP